MGLHLNYELRLPASTSPRDVAGVLERLRTFATTRSFEEVSALHTTAGVDIPIDPATDQARVIQTFASIIASPYDDDDPPLHGDVDSAQGFYINPGKGCETATFGFLKRADASDRHREWFWHAFCKTQYASVVSDDHLVMCHTSLVAVLDHAILLGIAVVVRDETHYWETRDEARLIAEVHAMNRLVAAFAGRFSDAVGTAHSVQAPIFEHPRFERLEMGE
jgi:hypothetical protein